MTIEDKFGDKPIRFRERNMSHLSAEEHLASINDSIEKYRQIHLSVELFDRTEGSIHLAEIKLAEDALMRGCKYVTNLNYHTGDNSIIILARGLIKK